MTKLFYDWFDPKNDEHVEAYMYLVEQGNWPSWFVAWAESELTRPIWDCAVTGAQAKLSEAYLEKYKMTKKPLDMEKQRKYNIGDRAIYLPTARMVEIVAYGSQEDVYHVEIVDSRKPWIVFEDELE